jgi:tetratricopeptide (TPR) repeat protein
MISKNPFGVILILPLIVLASVSILAQNRRSAIDYVARGTARMDANDLGGALADFTRPVELDRNYSASYFSRGLVRRRLSDLDGAIRGLKDDPGPIVLENALQLFPRLSHPAN